MIAPRVLTEDDVYAALDERGFEVTIHTTETGTYWKNPMSGRHLLVPRSVEGFYPDWMLYDLLSHIGEIVPRTTLKVRRGRVGKPKAAH